MAIHSTAPVRTGVSANPLARWIGACIPRALTSFLGWALLVASLHAQDLAMRHLDNRDGLPQSQVWALLEDRQGFIWAGTGDGLVRIGPNGSQLFDSANGLKAKYVTCLAEDREGAIWVSSQDRGLARIRGRQISNFGVDEGLQDESIHSLLETQQGALLAGSHRGLFQKRGERFEQVPLPGPWLSESITALAVDSENWVWMGSRKGALARWNGSRLEEVSLPQQTGSGYITRLKVDPSGQLWALQTERLLKRARDGTWSVESLPGLPSVVVLTDFSIEPTGELILVLGSDGLYLRSSDGAHQMLNAKGLPCRDSINCAIRDRNGALWSEPMETTSGPSLSQVSKA